MTPRAWEQRPRGAGEAALVGAMTTLRAWVPRRDLPDGAATPSGNWDGEGHGRVVVPGVDQVAW